MIEILSNAWVVGIGGGVFSGLLVTGITRYLFSKKDNREYVQNVAAANREIVYALRPGISEGHIPNEDVLVSLIVATARRYKVAKDDVFAPKQIAEELIKEIMDSSFISSETKRSYCETLAHLVRDRSEEDVAVEEASEKRSAEAEYRAKMITTMSLVLGLITTLFTMLAVFTQIIGGKLTSPFGVVFSAIFPAMAVLLATIVALAAMISIKRIRSRDGQEMMESIRVSFTSRGVDG